MKHLLACLHQFFVGLLLITLGVSVYGCQDSVSVSDDVQVPLSGLTVTPGTLQPGFSSNTTSYTVEAPTAATSVAVTASPRDSTTTITINGVATAAGQERTVPLGLPGSTTIIPIAVSSSTGTETAYTVTVTRLLSDDNKLTALTVTSGTLNPPFDPTTTSYTVDVATDITSVDVSATKSDLSAVMQIGSVAVPAGTAAGQANFQLGEPGTTTPVSINVTAPNGTPNTYTITVKRVPSNNDNLSGLTVNEGPLNPVFVAGTLNYSVDVPGTITSITVTATKSDPKAVMLVHSVTVPAGTDTGQATIPLNGPGADTPVSITVTAQNGVDVKTYVITAHQLVSR